MLRSLRAAAWILRMPVRNSPSSLASRASSAVSTGSASSRFMLSPSAVFDAYGEMYHASFAPVIETIAR